MEKLKLFCASKAKYDQCIGHRDRVSSELIGLIISVAHLDGFTDYNYLATLEKYKVQLGCSKASFIPLLNSSEGNELPLLKALLTYIVRADRFSCGTGETLVEYVVDGTISVLIERLNACGVCVSRTGAHDAKYRFYGWKNANVKPKNARFSSIRDPRDLYDLLSQIWCAATCAPRMREAWCAENKTLGQCSITAFLAQDIFGGKVYGILRPGGNYHCYNVVDGCVFDLTSEQFGDEVLQYSGNPEQFREVHFSKEEKRQRYEFLKARLLEALESRAVCTSGA